MEVLKTTQCYVAGDYLEFQYTNVLLAKDGQTFSARSSKRNPTSLDALYSIKELRPDEYCPRIPTGATVASPSNDVYTKKPNLLSDSDMGAISINTLWEVRACEVLRMKPHKNIALYHGCIAGDDRILGLCFTRYEITLMDKLNPGALNKSMFVEQAQQDGAERYMKGIEAGIKHLHSLGFVHNDITPSNIMIDKEDNAIVIDFDSCRLEGEHLQNVKRTHGWHDPQVKVSAMRNDLDAMEEIRVWLTEASADKFNFGKL